MEFIVTDKYGFEQGYLEHQGIDIDVGKDNDFEIEVDLNSYNPTIHQEGCMFFCEGTEYGGIIKSFEAIDSQQLIKLGGDTWRGKVNRIALDPVPGQDYRYINGEANGEIKKLFQEFGLSEMYVVNAKDSGLVFDNYKVPLHVMLADAFQEALGTIGGRLEFKYKFNGTEKGYILVEAVPITDYSERIEYSQDDNINVDILDYRNGVNHLICLGKGELSNRARVNLYAWPDGSIRKEQYYKGMDKNEEFYEYSSAENASVLEEYGRKRLRELMDYKEMEIQVEDGEYLEIGDIVGGRERITGMLIKSPVVQKIVQVAGNGVVTIRPKVKGE